MSYQLLAESARSKGYEVKLQNVDWKIPLSQQTFEVPESAVIFGFSLWAILAWLNAQRHPCKHLILASMTPHYSFTDKKIREALIDLTGAEFTKDIITNLSPKNFPENRQLCMATSKVNKQTSCFLTLIMNLTQNI